MSKIGIIITKNESIFILPNFALIHNEGFFLIHWIVSWLIRIYIDPPTTQILLAQSELLLIKVVAQILAILLAMWFGASSSVIHMLSGVEMTALGFVYG